MKKMMNSVCVLLVMCMIVSCVVFADGDNMAKIYINPSISAPAGEEFELPVYIENNPGITGFIISITYDKNIIEPVEDSETAGEIVPFIIANPRYLNKADTRIGTISAENFYGDGLLFSYKFRIKEEAASGSKTEMYISVDNNSVQSMGEDATISDISYIIEPSYTETSADGTEKINTLMGVVSVEINGDKNNSGSGATSGGHGVLNPYATSTPEPTGSPEALPSAKLKENANDIKYIMEASAGHLEPDRDMTRYEVVESLYELMDFENLSEHGKQFSDVDEKYQAIIDAFSQTPIIDGYPDGTFGGNSNITRAEFVKVISLAAGIEPDISKETPLTDIDNHWGRGYIAAFVDAGYIYGYPDNTFLPDNNVTRAEAVAIINRVIKKTATPEAENRFYDIEKTHWAYGDIMSAVK